LPLIPVYKRQISTPGKSGNAFADAGSAGMVGNAVTRLGNTGLMVTNDFADLITRQNEKIKKQDADNSALTIGAAFDEEHYSFMSSALAETGSDTYDNLDRVKGHTEESIKKYTDGIDDPYLTNKIKEHILSRSASAQGTLAHHQASQRRTVSDNAIKMTLDTTAKAAYSGIDDLPTTIERFNRAVGSQVANGSRDEASAEAFLMEGHSVIAESYIEGVINRNAAAGAELIKSGTLNQYLSRTKVDEFGKKANLLAEAQKKDAEAEKKEQERLADEKKKEAQEATENAFVSRFVSGKLTTAEILKSNIAPQRKEHWIDQIRIRGERFEAKKKEGTFKTDKVIEGQLYTRIVKDPESVTEDEILGHLGSNLTQADAKQLIDERTRRIKGDVDPATAEATKAVLKNMERDRKAKIFGEGQAGDLEHAKQVEGFKRWLKKNPDKDPSEYYEKVMTPVVGEKLFGFMDGVNPKKQREGMEAAGEIPKGKTPVQKKLVGHKDGKPVYDIGGGKWQIGD
jgi:hypothetical protein